MRTLILTALGVGTLALAPRAAEPPLLSYLQVGSHRIAFASDTIVEHGARVPLVQSTFADVQRALGPAVVNQHGDAGDFLAWVCYRMTGAPRMSLLLESSEMGGGKSITDFELIPAGSRDSLEHRCATTDVPSSSIVSNTGVRLGLTRSEVNARLGVVGRDSADVVVYDRSQNLQMRGRDGRRNDYTQDSGFIVRFVRGRVAWFSGYRLDSI